MKRRNIFKWIILSVVYILFWIWFEVIMGFGVKDIWEDLKKKMFNK